MVAGAAGTGVWTSHATLDERSRLAIVAASITVVIAAHGTALAWRRWSRGAIACLLIGAVAIGALRVAIFDLQWHTTLASLGTEVGSPERLAWIDGVVVSTPRNDEYSSRDALIACGALEEDTLARFVPRSPTVRFNLAVESLLDASGHRFTHHSTIRVIVAGSSAGCASGQRVLVRGWLRGFDPPNNPGGFDSIRWSRSRSITGVISIASPQLIEVVDDAPATVEALLSRWRARVDRALHESIGRDPHLDATALIAASTTGAVWPGLRSASKAFAACGLQHLVAISGFNFGILAACALWLVRRTGCAPRVGGVALIALALLFVGSIESEVSSLRAALMGGSAALALSLGRSVPFGSIMGFSAIVIVAVDPVAPSEPGFQLSFGAIFGLRYLALPLADLCLRITPGDGIASVVIRRVFDPISAAVGAWIAAAPIVAWHFGVVQVLCVPCTILLSPLFASMVVLGNATLVLEPLCAPVADVVGGVAIWNARAVLVVTRWCSTLPTAIDPQSGVRVIHDDVQWRLRMDMIDVGNGSCHLIRSGDCAVLFDCGSLGSAAVGSQIVVPALRALGVKTIAAIVVSHPNLDHYGAVPEVIRAFDVRRLMTTTQFVRWAREQGGSAEAALHSARDAGATLETVGVGDALSFGSMNWTVIHPPRDGSFADSNDGSLVIRVTDGAFAIVLCGDAAREACQAVLHPSRAAELRGVVVLELPHHGSFRPESAALAERIASPIVLQSTGAARLRKDKWGELLADSHRLVTAHDHACAVAWKHDGRIALGRWIGDRYLWSDTNILVELPNPLEDRAGGAVDADQVTDTPSPLTVTGDHDRTTQDECVADGTTATLFDLDFEWSRLDRDGQLNLALLRIHRITREFTTMLTNDQSAVGPLPQRHWNFDERAENGEALGDFVDEPYRPPDLDCAGAQRRTERRITTDDFRMRVFGAGECWACWSAHRGRQ